MFEKDYKLDTIRVISMFLVIFIHLANYYCRAYASISTASYIGAIIINTIARVSVPIFFMISGALLLSKPYNAKKNKKRIIKMLITTIIFTIIYLIWDYYFLEKKIPNLISLLASPERSMLWFLYAIIALYIALPFTKCMVDNMDKHLDKLFIILWLFFAGAINVLRIGLNIEPDYEVPIIGGTYYLGYFVIGYIIYKNRNKIKYKKYELIHILLLIASMLCTIGITLYFSYKKDTYFDSCFHYRSILIMISSICTYILLLTNLKNKKYKLINFISTYTFGVYLVHGILLNILMRVIFPFKEVISFIGIPICFILLIIPSIIIVFILKKIPIVKDYL